MDEWAEGRVFTAAISEGERGLGVCELIAQFLYILTLPAALLAGIKWDMGYGINYDSPFL
jgi:hypothetical protein